MNQAIAIFGCDADAELKRALQELANVLQLQPEFSPAENVRDFAATVSVQKPGEAPVALPSLLQFVSGQDASSNVAGATIEFSGHSALPELMRRQKIPLGKESSWQFLDDPKFGEVVASVNGRPVWRIAKSSGGEVWSVSTPSPRLSANGRLCEQLNGETFLPLLPLYLFLRNFSPESRWPAPPLRACLVVDDPNLHAPTYGHIDYRALAALAQEKHFHAAMATIPLDAWRANAEAVSIFRENPRTLSLLVHGNDHLRDELARPFNHRERNELVMQSLQRIGSLERRTGLGVDRVMAPPHGVCAHQMLDTLRSCGYDGMTTNRWSLQRHNPAEQLPAGIGLRPADFLGGGLPVLNRFRFKSSICRGEIFMAAALRQPVIPYGHHQDFADGMASLHETIDAVNSLGNVRWMSLREILESNFEQRVESGALHVRLFSRRIKLTPPDGITSVNIESISPGNESARKYEIISPNGNIPVSTGVTATIPAGVKLEIREMPAPLPATAVRPAYKSTVACLRRIVSETRDRLRI